MTQDEFDKKIKAAAVDELFKAQHPFTGTSLYEHLYIKGAAKARELLMGEMNYDEWITESTGLKIKQRVVNCSDCKKRVETYVKSIKQFQDEINRLRADLALAVSSIKAAEQYLSSCGYGQKTAIDREPEDEMVNDFRKTLAKLGVEK